MRAVGRKCSELCPEQRLARDLRLRMAPPPSAAGILAMTTAGTRPFPYACRSPTGVFACPQSLCFSGGSLRFAFS